jgi:hypothetical protein
MTHLTTELSVMYVSTVYVMLEPLEGPQKSEKLELINVITFLYPFQATTSKGDWFLDVIFN